MGASQTKQVSILQQVNDIVNETVNKSVTNISTSASAAQSMVIECTPKQQELAQTSNVLIYQVYGEMMKSYQNKGSIGTPPKEPILMCTAEGVSQNATVSLSSDTSTLNNLSSEITAKLKEKAEQVDKLTKETPLAGYSETEKLAISKIITNVSNETLNENITNIVNTAIVTQDLRISGSGVRNINQEATVNLIAGAIMENITKGTNLTDIEIESKQDSSADEKSGQLGAVKAVTTMIGNIAASLMGAWMLILVCIIGAVVMFPGVFCMLPPLRIPLGLMGLCSKKNNEQQQQQQQQFIPPPQFIPQPQYQQQQQQQQFIPPPQFIPQPQYQPQYQPTYQQSPQSQFMPNPLPSQFIPYPSAPRDYSNIIVPKNDQ